MALSLYDVVVVGSGPAGIATAVAAGRSGFSTVLVDADDGREADVPDGRTVALTAAARDRLIDLGLWDSVAPHAWTVRGVRVRDCRIGREHLYRARPDGTAGLLYVVPYRRLRACLARALADAGGIHHLRPRRLCGMQLAGSNRETMLDDGSTLRARLVVGADGRSSTVRELAGLACRRTDFPQTALTFVVQWQQLDPDTALECLTDEGPISVLPLGGALFAVTWIASATAAARRRTLSPATFMEELAAALGLAFDDRNRLVSPVTASRLSLAHPDRYVAPRLVLVGDAAHGGHPVPAQGVNMATADVHELVVLWRFDKGRVSCADTLARFQRSRRMANAARLGLTDIFNRLFGSEAAPFVFLGGATGTPGEGAPHATAVAANTYDDDQLVS